MPANWLSRLFVLILPLPVIAQGFAGLGTDADGYALVREGIPLDFPADHGPHFDFRIEWWYVTANLTDDAGVDYGVQFTLFRQAAAPPPQRDGWESQQFWLGHAAVTTENRHVAAERLARGGIGQAGVDASPFAAWIDHWTLETTSAEQPGLRRLRLKASDEDFAYNLTLTTDEEPVPQGNAGYSVKSDRGQASYYYSQPYFTVGGSIEIEGRRESVNGKAWMDREWSSQPLAPDQSGWDWFSLHFESGAKLMAFRLRQDDGSHYMSGNWIEGGVSTPISGEAIRMTPAKHSRISNRAIPTSWHLEIPSHDLSIRTEALNTAAWNDHDIAYWEGPIKASGSHGGVGYLEMTGY
ncbi:MAG: lipocalin-like domain-containing protein [Pseudomonadota bacterium]